MRVLVVTGTRYGLQLRPDAAGILRDVIVRWQPSLVVHGAAYGVDSVAGDIADQHGIQQASMPALWSYHGKRAGMIRNRAMAELADTLRRGGAEIWFVAIPDTRSVGTRGMVRELEALGIPGEVWEQ